MSSCRNNSPTLMMLPLEVICHILKFLPIRKVLQLESVSKGLQHAVLEHLRTLTKIDFKEDVPCEEMFNYTISNLSNSTFDRFLDKLPKLKYIYGFYPENILTSCDDNDSVSVLSCRGVCSSLNDHRIKGIEINNIRLLEYICSSHLDLQIIGIFKSFRKCEMWPKIIKLNEISLQIAHLHLENCAVEKLVNMDDYLEEVYLRNVVFTNENPFINVSMRKLKSFSMSRCLIIGPNLHLPERYEPLIQALAEAYQLHTLHLQDMYYRDNSFVRICEKPEYQESFKKLESIVLGNNKYFKIEDIVCLLTRCSNMLTSLTLQPSLCKDRLFQTLNDSGITMNTGFKELYLGWKDDIDQTLGEEIHVDEKYSKITDNGLQLVGQCFPSVEKLDIRNSLHLKDPGKWFTPGSHYFKSIEELCISGCQGIEPDLFSQFIKMLPNLTSLCLEEMFLYRSGGTTEDSFRVIFDRDESFIASNGKYYLKPQGGALNGDNCLMEPYGSILNHPVIKLSCKSDVGNQQIQISANQNNPCSSNFMTNQYASYNHGNDSSANENGRKTEMSVELSNQKEVNRSLHSYQTRSKSRNVKSSSFTVSHSMEGLSHHGDGKRNSAESTKRKKRKFENSCSKDLVASVSQEPCPCGSDWNDEPTVSKKGKSSVTKKGVAGELKSLKQRKSDRRKTNKLKECTCSNGYKDSGSQTTLEDTIQTYQRCYLGDTSISHGTMVTDRIITPGIFHPDVGIQRRTLSDKYKIHTANQDRTDNSCVTLDSMLDFSDFIANTPCYSQPPCILQISHEKLEHLRINDISLSELNINCDRLFNLSVSGCVFLKTIKFVETPCVENIEISNCWKFNEELFLKELYKVPSDCSKIVYLRPRHFVDSSLFYDIMRQSSSNLYGSVMMFDYSDKPSHTEYNKYRMESWIFQLERMAEKAISELGFSKYLEMKKPHKEISCLAGNSDDGSDWTLLSDIPWLDLLHQCPDVDDTDTCKGGIYCMEEKGHEDYRDMLTSIQDSLKEKIKEPSDIGLYNHNIFTYINTCDCI